MWLSVDGLTRAVFTVLLVLLSACSGPKTHLSMVGHVSSAERPEMLSDEFRMNDGYMLPYRIYKPVNPKAVVIALHGFNDYSKAFESLCDYFYRQEIACIAYDQRGFGATVLRGIWPGEGVLQADLKAVIGLVREDFNGTPLYLLGESMGGAVIMSGHHRYQTFFDQHVTGSVLLAPAVWARHTQPWYQRWLLWMAVHTVPSWKPTGEGLEIQATDNIEALRAMSSDPLVIKETRIDSIYGLNNLMDEALETSSTMASETLILYGERDEVIPKEPTCAMLTGLPLETGKPEFKLYPDGYHMLSRDLQAGRVFADASAWILDRASLVNESVEGRESLCDA